MDRCFDIGISGGCGVDCAAFCDGDCEEPQELQRDDIVDEHGLEEALNIMLHYDCFLNDMDAKNINWYPERTMNPPEVVDAWTDIADNWREKLTLQDALLLILRSAIHQAREISRREKVAADRIERVGIFKHCLRSEIKKATTGDVLQYLISVLPQARLWWDIGVMNQPSQKSWFSGCFHRGAWHPKSTSQLLSHAILKPILEEAMSITPECEVQEDLRELREANSVCERQIAQAESLNRQAESVAENLLEALSQ